MYPIGMNNCLIFFLTDETAELEGVLPMPRYRQSVIPLAP